jgi:hypothetical protein
MDMAAGSSRCEMKDGGGVLPTSEAAPCPLQPCYFDKWDIFADTWDCQYAMGLPVCIFNNLLPIFPISCHLLMSE